ncbi:MAG: quinate 5-dehydrogenase [Desulfitobacteriaceae bacterium]|nr:quinate 5-dehydrogenase [Desulfitobacteriaceae bacterium]MDD4752439.1 quinate 5-dehydrogenase [Desulfitobacteriaceae bacterium]
MKRVVSVSLGSAKRDHAVVTEILGERFSIERIGTDGDVKKAMEMISALDGKVDAIGLGGTDLYIYAGGKRYAFRESLKLKNCARITPVVDGSSLKNTLERRVIYHLEKQMNFSFAGKKVLMVSAVDRFGMAEALCGVGSNVIFGDLMFGLGIPIPIYSFKALSRVARIVAPLIVNLPIKVLYPTGSKQEVYSPKHENYYREAEIIAGDFLFIKKHMPAELPGKTIITNTVTSDDIEDLKRRGVGVLVTTTPELKGRSFGTNVMEGVLVALAGKGPEELTADNFNTLLDRIGFVPRVEYLKLKKMLNN